MPSKYAKVFSRLEKLPEDPTYRDQIQALKQSISNRNPPALARTYASLRDKKTRIEEELKGVNLQIEAVSQLLVVAYETDSLVTLKLTSGRSVRVQPEPYAQVEDKEKFRLWCIENKLEKEMHLAWQSTNSLTKERLLEGQPEPDGIKAFIKDKIILRKA
jgi:hypothetical protein